MNPVAVTRRPEPTAISTPSARTCRADEELRAIAASWRTIATNNHLSPTIRATYRTVAQRLEQETTATGTRPCPCQHDQDATQPGQHIATHLTRVATNITTINSGHNNAELITDLLDRADIHRTADTLRRLATAQPRLRIDPTHIAVTPLLDDADIEATLRSPSAVDLGTAVVHWSTTLINLHEPPTTSNVLLGLTPNNHLVRLHTPTP
ncbi:hypothetical protein ACFQ1S_05925 [Kibdelosporangium lantanae]|uniref:DUF222 domain-containing protein n=1 Tax=Kibdelosporangium lantanae TaxID=1497396 RepID=A0ABW3M4F4_9PSEU